LRQTVAALISQPIPTLLVTSADTTSTNLFQSLRAALLECLGGDTTLLHLEQVQHFLTLPLRSESKFNAAICLINDADVNIFTHLRAHLSPSSPLLLVAPTLPNATQSPTWISHMTSELKISGFDKVIMTTDTDTVMMTAWRPEWELGTSTKLNFGTKSNGTLLSKKPKRVWEVVTSNGDEEEELINEDALLDEEDLRKPSTKDLSRPEGCETKKKACKTCTCGRAEEEMSQQQSTTTTTTTNNTIASGQKTRIAVVDTAQVKSSCGSCYLGDAFRCSTCPYMGIPAFKPGEQVVLNGMLQDDDLDL